MPTRVHFNSDVKDILLKEDFEQVNGQLNEHKAGLFTLHGGPQTRVTIYRSGLAYIEEVQSGETKPMVGAA